MSGGDNMGPYDIVLIIPPISQIHYPYIAVPLLKSVTADAGYSVKVYDVNIAYFNYLISQDPVFSRINDGNRLNDLFADLDAYAVNSRFTEAWVKTCSNEAKVFGFSLTSQSCLPWALQAAAGIKEARRDALIIFGGVFCDAPVARYVLSDYDAVDLVVLGEGEDTLLEILQRFYDPSCDCLTNIKGTAVKQKGREVIINESPPLRTALDSLPFPDYSCLPIEDYLNFKSGTRVLPILGSRGCTGSCSFCVEWGIWSKFRTRSAENVVEEIKYQVDTHNVQFIRFNNSLINGNLKILEETCDRIIEAGLNLTWFASARIRKGMTTKILTKMYQSGCRYIWYGIESASPRILKIMKKPLDITAAPKILRETKAAGIKVLTFWITNFPGELPEDTDRSLDFLRMHGKYIDYPRFRPFNLLKGTDMAHNPRKYGISLKEIDILGNPIWAYDREPFLNNAVLSTTGFEYCNLPLIPWNFIGIF
jgi:radical SAM superfamily enzyme YgiQ (UPF0313 family)